MSSNSSNPATGHHDHDIDTNTFMRLRDAWNALSPPLKFLTMSAIAYLTYRLLPLAALYDLLYELSYVVVDIWYEFVFYPVYDTLITPALIYLMENKLLIILGGAMIWLYKWLTSKYIEWTFKEEGDREPQHWEQGVPGFARPVVVEENRYGNGPGDEVGEAVGSTVPGGYIASPVSDRETMELRKSISKMFD